MLACARLAASCCSRTASRSAHQVHAQACLSLRQPLAITAPAAPSREKDKNRTFRPVPFACVHPAVRCLFFSQAVCSLRCIPGDVPRSLRNAPLRRLWLFYDRYTPIPKIGAENRFSRDLALQLSNAPVMKGQGRGPGEGAPSPGEELVAATPQNAQKGPQELEVTKNRPAARPDPKPGLRRAARADPREPLSPGRIFITVTIYLKNDILLHYVSNTMA